MNIGDLLLALQGGQDPNKAIMAAAQGDASGAPPPPPANVAASLPPVPSPAPAPAPQASGTPQGATTPVTDPIPSDAAPRIMKSPPDLSNMYLALMRQNQNAAQLDSGLTMMAAGVSNSPATRAALIAASAKEGAGGQKFTSEDMVRLQKLNLDNQALQIRQAAKAGLMKKYGLDRDTTDYLDSSGKLDEVIQHKNTQNLIHVTASDGSSAFYDPVTSKKVSDISGPSAPKTQVVEGPNGPELRNVDASGGFAQVGASAGAKPSADQTTLNQVNTERAAAGKAPMDMETFLKTVKKGGVTVNVGPNGENFPALEKGQAYYRNDDGTVKIFPDGKPQAYSVAGSKVEGDIAHEGAQTTKLTKEQEEKVKKEGMQHVQSQFLATNVGTAVQRALELYDKPGVTGFGSDAMRAVAPGGSPVHSFDAALKTITGNATVQAVNQMRQASTSGGALGQISDYEDKLLQSTTANVSHLQDPADVAKALIRHEAAVEVMANKQYTDAKEFQKDLDARIQELTVQHQNNKQKSGKAKYGVEPL